MSKRQPKRSDAKKSLYFWACALRASCALPKDAPAPPTLFPSTNYAAVPLHAIALHELADRLVRLADGESVRVVFGRRLPVRRQGRPSAHEVRVRKYQALLAAGKSKRKAAAAVHSAVKTLERPSTAQRVVSIAIRRAIARQKRGRAPLP